MKVWLITHDTGYLIHVSDWKATKIDIQDKFKHAEIRELQKGVTENTFYLNISTEVTLTIE